MNLHEDMCFVVHLNDLSIEMLPKVGFSGFGNGKGMVEIKHSNSVWIIFNDGKVLSLNIKSKKWIK